MNRQRFDFIGGSKKRGTKKEVNLSGDFRDQQGRREVGKEGLGCSV